VRIWAIQDLLLCFRYHPIVQQVCLWLDQHAPLLLALEAGEEACALDTEYNPIENQPFLPTLPKNCNMLLPMLWASKSTTYLRQYPILRLLWKAAPRKSHSNDVATMVKALIHDSQAASSVILSIHRASMLGNYSHAHKQPPLPLRFKIYRMDAEKSMLQTISKVFFGLKFAS